MSKWIEVDRDQLDQPRVQMRNGVELQVFASPYDIPTAVRGEYNKDVGKFVIQLRYSASPEERIQLAPNDHVRLHIGKNSSRLYQAELDVDKLDAKAVSLLIHSIDAIPIQHQGHRPVNYEVTKRLLESRKKDLVLEPA